MQSVGNAVCGLIDLLNLKEVVLMSRLELLPHLTENGKCQRSLYMYLLS